MAQRVKALAVQLSPGVGPGVCPGEKLTRECPSVIPALRQSDTVRRRAAWELRGQLLWSAQYGKSNRTDCRDQVERGKKTRQSCPLTSTGPMTCVPRGPLKRNQIKSLFYIRKTNLMMKYILVFCINTKLI